MSYIENLTPYEIRSHEKSRREGQARVKTWVEQHTFDCHAEFRGYSRKDLQADSFEAVAEEFARQWDRENGYRIIDGEEFRVVVDRHDGLVRHFIVLGESVPTRFGWADKTVYHVRIA